jgi:fructose-1,6-bisphosphatase/inositol monophosphatase family enzyme
LEDGDEQRRWSRKMEEEDGRKGRTRRWDKKCERMLREKVEEKMEEGRTGDEETNRRLTGDEEGIWN